MWAHRSFITPLIRQVDGLPYPKCIRRYFTGEGQNVKRNVQVCRWSFNAFSLRYMKLIKALKFVIYYASANVGRVQVILFISLGVPTGM